MQIIYTIFASILILGTISHAAQPFDQYRSWPQGNGSGSGCCFPSNHTKRAVEHRVRTPGCVDKNILISSCAFRPAVLN